MTCAACNLAIRADESRVELAFFLSTGRKTQALLAHTRCIRLEPTGEMRRRDRVPATVSM